MLMFLHVAPLSPFKYRFTSLGHFADTVTNGDKHLESSDNLQ